MLYFVTPGKGAFPGIRRLFKETQLVVGGELLYLNELQKVGAEDAVMFGAWHPNYSIAIRRCKAKRKYLHWASPLLQTELAGVEVEYLSTIFKLLDRKILNGLWVIDMGIYDTCQHLGDNIYYAPAPFDPKHLRSYCKSVSDRSEIMFFTVFHNRQKNPLVQFAAAKLAQKERPFTLYVNGLTPSQTAFVDMLQLKYCDLHFLPTVDYFEWLSTAKLGLQVSASEAFSYVAAEILALGVPLIMSPVIAKNMGITDKRLIISDISSVEEIRSAILNVLHMPDTDYGDMCSECQAAVEVTAEKNKGKIRWLFNYCVQ